MAYGSIQTGPSELYLQLLKGEITPEDYAKRAKKRIQRKIQKRSTSTFGPHQRA